MSAKSYFSGGLILTAITIVYVDFLHRHYYTHGATGLSGTIVVTVLYLLLFLSGLFIAIGLSNRGLKHIHYLAIKVIIVLALSLLVAALIEVAYFLIAHSWFLNR